MCSFQERYIQKHFLINLLLNLLLSCKNENIIQVTVPQLTILGTSPGTYLPADCARIDA